MPGIPAQEPAVYRDFYVSDSSVGCLKIGAAYVKSIVSRATFGRLTFFRV